MQELPLRYLNNPLQEMLTVYDAEGDCTFGIGLDSSIPLNLTAEFA